MNQTKRISFTQPIHLPSYRLLVMYLPLIAVVQVFLFWSCTDRKSTRIQLQALEFSQQIDALSSETVVDVRTPGEYAKGHIPDAVNMDWNGSDFHRQIASLDRSSPVFVYCLSGARSADAAEVLRAAGYQVYELQGGILKWRAADLPEESANMGMSPGMTLDMFQQSISSTKRVLINFYADWCAPCRKMEPGIQNIATSMADQLEVIRINADDHQQLCKDLGVDALPVLHLYENAELTWSHTGFIANDDLLIHLR